jgi:hypothetical protein
MTLALTMLLTTGCSAAPAVPETTAPSQNSQLPVQGQEAQNTQVVDIVLNGQNVTVGGRKATQEGAVYLSRDIVYYEEKTHYESGNPYGEGREADMHSAQEAAEHLVVNITQPGTYRLSGNLDKGQIRIDLGEDAKKDPNAVVNLILDGVDISCTVAPAIVFRNVYECDGKRNADNATPDVDTTAAGANLILAEGSSNLINGSYVAKIFKDQENEKKLVKQDGAIYSYMSMNIYGPGRLEVNAQNEGIGTEMHLTIHSGDILIRSQNDGINTNEDGVSVTTILDGSVIIMAGLGEEGDGIDSNGFLVIRGGTVLSSANPRSDAGLDSDLGSFIHGGTVVAMGAAMDWAESDSEQVTINLQFAQTCSGNIRIAREDGTEVFSFDPTGVVGLAELNRSYQGMIISCPEFQVGEGYYIFLDGVQMAYTGTDVMMGPGGMGGFPGSWQGGEGGVPGPDDMPEPPEGDFEIPPQPGQQMPGQTQGQPPQGGPGGFPGQPGEPQSLFFMQDKVNFFSGVKPVE